MQTKKTNACTQRTMYKHWYYDCIQKSMKESDNTTKAGNNRSQNSNATNQLTLTQTAGTYNTQATHTNHTIHGCHIIN